MLWECLENYGRHIDGFSNLNHCVSLMVSGVIMFENYSRADLLFEKFCCRENDKIIGFYLDLPLIMWKCPTSNRSSQMLKKL